MNAEIFRQNVRELLRAKGLKQKELAEKSGLSYSWIRKVCSQGLTRVEDRNRDQLEKVCAVLGVSPVEQLWNPKMLYQHDDASTYAAKVEEILRATRTNNDFIQFESVGEHSVVDLVGQINLVHEALEQHQETISERQRQQADATRRRTTSRRPSQPSEYAEKIRSLIRNDRPELRAVVAAIRRMIDGACDIEEGIRVEERLKRDRPKTDKRLLSSSGGNVDDVQEEPAASSSDQDDNELLEQLASQGHPSKRKPVVIPAEVAELMKRARGEK